MLEIALALPCIQRATKPTEFAIQHINQTKLAIRLQHHITRMQRTEIDSLVVQLRNVRSEICNGLSR